eukprot:COSAG01_NODE_1805_length_9192_cov_13.807324_12_plen_169_part_00
MRAWLAGWLAGWLAAGLRSADQDLRFEFGSAIPSFQKTNQYCHTEIRTQRATQDSTNNPTPLSSMTFAERRSTSCTSHEASNTHSHRTAPIEVSQSGLWITWHRSERRCCPGPSSVRSRVALVRLRRGPKSTSHERAARQEGRCRWQICPVRCYASVTGSDPVPCATV